MATVVNNPNGNDSGSAGWVVAIIVLILVVLAAIFLLPKLMGNTTPTETTPTGNEVPVNNTYNTTINASTTNSDTSVTASTTLP